MKGKSTIQLFDAKTNTEVKRVVNENMVTNAINNILNIPNDYLGVDGSFKSNLDKILPLSTQGLGGIILWEDTLTEDADCVLPQGGKEVGHAGGTYTGTNVLRGTLNENESCTITNGYRWVWDFATDRANGTIKSLSLTHREGGNAGFENATDNVHNAVVLSIPIYYNTVLGEVEQGKWCVLTAATANSITIAYTDALNTAAIDFNANITNNNFKLYDYKTISYNLSTTANYSNSYVDDTGIYHICTYYSQNPPTFNHIAIDIVNGKLLKEEQIVLKGIDNYNTNIYGYCNVYKDYFYTLLRNKENTDCFLKFKTDGSFLKELIKGTPSGSGYFCIIGDWLSVNNSFMLNTKTDKIVKTNSPIACRGVYSYRAKQLLPCFFTHYAQYQSYAAELYMPYFYLATINNLAEPVLKTSSQTMKITYELTTE